MDIKIKRLIFGILIIANCVIIFSFSAQNSEKSQKTSGFITDKVVDIIVNVNKKVKKEEIADNVSFCIRKIAHFSIYTSLGVWLMCEASTFNISKKKKLLTSIFCGATYAITDEFHQSFVGGRSPEIRDVCIDTCGVIFGCILVILAFKIKRRMKYSAGN